MISPYGCIDNANTLKLSMYVMLRQIHCTGSIQPSFIGLLIVLKNVAMGTEVQIISYLKACKF